MIFSPVQVSYRYVDMSVPQGLFKGLKKMPDKILYTAYRRLSYIKFA